MKVEDRIRRIVDWIKDYTTNIKNKPITTLVVGVSGGIDSAVTSTLCAKTNIKTITTWSPIKGQLRTLHDVEIMLEDDIILKISGIWNNYTSCGLTFRFYIVNHL